MRIPSLSAFLIPALLAGGCVELKVTKLDGTTLYKPIGWTYNLLMVQSQIVAARTVTRCENSTLELKYGVTATYSLVSDPR